MASVRAETYSNLFSLAVEHFNSVLDQYPLMRRTMESIAAERLNKIGKNPQLVSQREDLETDLQAVNELLQAQEELDYGDNSICDTKTHSDHGQLNVTTKSSGGGLFRVKSESCFRLSLVPSMIKPAAIAGAGGGPSFAAGSGGSAAASGGSAASDGNTTSGASRDGDQPSNPAASGAASGVNQSKSSFNLHNLLR